MPKVKRVTVVVKCECDKCGQVAHVEPNQTHAFCRGFKITKPLPMLFRDLHKTVKGTWRPWEAKPVVQVLQDATPMPTEEIASN